MPATDAELKTILGLEGYTPPDFFSSIAQIEDAPTSHPYAHTMRRAWSALGLSGILCVDRRPTAYIKELSRVTPEIIREQQRKLWNHGTASLLLLLTRREVFVLSSLAYPAKADETPSADGRLVTTLNIASEALELRGLVQRIESGQIYSEYPNSFVSNRNVDNYLLENLSAVRDRLLAERRGWSHQTVHTLLGRIIFTCYLVDRKVIGQRQFSEAGAEGETRLQGVFIGRRASVIQSILTRLFSNLQEAFNGSLFVSPSEEPDLTLSEDQIESLRCFLNGEEVRTHQQTFGFWVYDFSVIPIETISAMYEEFLAAEDDATQRTSGAYYTRRHLAELVVDTATELVSDLHTKRCLDPACGSGIFLVILFNRMAEDWRRNNPKVRNVTRARALIEILKHNLCGVDVRETACRITCFSLYLALLDQLKPRDIQELQKQLQTVLPDILALARNHHEARDAAVIYECDFFDTKVSLPGNFDIIIGNPPWVSRGKSDNQVALAWCNSPNNPHLTDAPTTAKGRRAQFMPEKQIVHAFLWKAPLHLGRDGLICLLIPAKALLNERTNAFQAAWFKQHAVDKIVQLADLSFILFEHAACPSTIVRVLNASRDPASRIEFLAPKTDNDDPRRDVITIAADDLKQLSTNDILFSARREAAPVLWKRLLWGTPRDIRLLDRLSLLPTLGSKAGSAQESKRWLKGQGVQRAVPSTTAPKPIWWERNRLFANARNHAINLVITEEECERVGTRFDSLHRERDHNLFEPPLVLISQGFSRVAFCSFPVIFVHSLQSISGPQRDANLLRFLAAYIGSKLAKYFLFHTAVNWGTERDKVHLSELLKLPFPLPHETERPNSSKQILNRIAAIMVRLEKSIKTNQFGRDQLVDTAYEDINPLLFEYFDIDETEQLLIEDTYSVYEPSSTPSSKLSDIPTLRRTSRTERAMYAARLCDTLNGWANRGPWRIQARAEISERSGLSILTLTKTKETSPYQETETFDDLHSSLVRLWKARHQRRAGLIHILGLKVFDGPNIHILKSTKLRDWTQTAALNDADEIAASILAPRGL